MKKQIFKVSLAIILSGIVLCSAAIAEEKKELPKSGSLSSSISGISSDVAVPVPWGGTDPRGQEAAPITGSVSKVTPTRWIARVANNSQTDTYSANFSVNQFNRNGTKIKSDSFSYTLKPGQKEERDIAALASTEQCSLDLVSWNKKGGK